MLASFLASWLTWHMLWAEINIHQTSHKELQVACVRLLKQANEGAVYSWSKRSYLYRVIGKDICTAAVITGYFKAGNFAGTNFHKSAKDPFLTRLFKGHNLWPHPYYSKNVRFKMVATRECTECALHFGSNGKKLTDVSKCVDQCCWEELPC